MAGSMRERSPGVWQLRAYLGKDPLTGNPIQASRTFKGTGAAAKKALARLVTEVDDRKFDRTRATMGQLLDLWLAGLSRKPSTIRDYQSAVDHAIRPALGDVRLATLKADKLDACYRAWLTEEVSPGVKRSATTVRKYHAIIRAALHQAVKWDWIDRNPAENASPPSAVRTEMTVPSPAELQALIRDAEAHDPVLAFAIALAALTGARRGELCALRWSDVKVDRLVIARSISQVQGVRHEGDTKTHQVRVIALDEIARDVLAQRRLEVERLSTEADSPLVEDPYVLSYRADAGQAINPDTLTGGFRRCANRLGLKYHFHELRHFAATEMFGAGVDPRTVGGRLGHADASVTAKTYAHMIAARDQEAAAALGRAFALSKEAT